MFSACLKKDILEQFRRKKFYIFLALAIGIAFLSIFSTFLISTIMKSIDLSEMGDMGEMVGIFGDDYYASISTFMSYMITYFIIVVTCMVMNAISKEIKNKVWVAPMCSGIKSSHMILSKIIAYTLSTVTTAIAACLVHLIFTVILFQPSEMATVGNLFACYGTFLLFLIFTVVVTMSINAISKRGWVAPVIMITLLILGTSVMQIVEIGEFTTLIMYTPYAFYDLCYNIPSFAAMGALEWVVSSLTYVGIIVLMLTLAISSNKIKASKN